MSVRKPRKLAKMKKQVRYDVEHLSVGLDKWVIYGSTEKLSKARGLKKWLEWTGYDARVIRVTREEVR